MSSQGAANASPSVFPGATISGRFRIERLLGRGSMGSVWLARHLALDVDVAVKFIDAAFRNQHDHRSRFVLEAQAAARINSPHVVNVLDFGEDGDRLYIAMEYLVGEDLGSFLERAPRLSVEVTARILAHACRGLGKAHALGIAHRDIKPENLFLCGDVDDEGFVVKILDFGVAKLAQKSGAPSGTSAGQLIGSPAFMSPEQARGLPEVDGRSDLFSLGVVAYHCLTGTTPFGGESLTDILFGIIGADPEPVTRLVPGLPRALDAWFDRALEKDPARRFASAKDMSQGFYSAIGRHATSATDYLSPRAAAPRDYSGTVITEDAALPISQYPERPSAPEAARPASTSNATVSSGVEPVLAQLGESAGVLGVGLVAPDMQTVAHHSLANFAASSFAELVSNVCSALDPFENLEPAQPRCLGLHFERCSALLRWVDGYVLVALGAERVNPTLLAVNLNSAASKLQTLAEQAGGAATAFRATLSGGSNEAAPVSAPASPSDPVPEAVLSRLTQLYAKPLGAMGRLAILQRLKSSKPNHGNFGEFVRSVATSIADPAERDSFVRQALELVPQASRVQPVAAPVPRKKRVIMYRGRKMEVDD
jgi:serine/threonine protein kinase